MSIPITPQGHDYDDSMRASAGVASPKSTNVTTSANQMPITRWELKVETNSMEHNGGCHCGNIHVRLRLSKPPEDCSLRACTCSFCRSHRPRIVSDRDGNFEVWADDWLLVENYRFGTRTCDFLICRRCGVFIAAMAQTPAGTRAVVNVNCLDDRERFTADPVLHNFEGETLETRSSRRATNWMPAIIR
jgi:hypothetical protein